MRLDNLKCPLSIILISVFVFTSCMRSMRLTFQLFGLDISSIHYTVIEREEEWIPNGDGQFFFRASIKDMGEKERQEFKNRLINNGAAPLPVIEDVFLAIPSKYKDKTSSSLSPCGLYILIPDKRMKYDYSLFIYDESNQEIIIQVFAM